MLEAVGPEITEAEEAWGNAVMPPRIRGIWLRNFGKFVSPEIVKLILSFSWVMGCGVESLCYCH